MKRAIGIFAVALFVASCTTTTKAEYASATTALAGSSRLRAEVKSDCVKNLPKRLSRKDMESIALVMDISSKKAIPLFCSRIVDAIAKNKMSYEEYSRGGVTPHFIKIIQGRA